MRNMVKGFTLVEILMVVSVSTVIGIYLVSVLLGNTGFSSKQNTIITQGISLNDLTDAINSQIRQAQSIAVGYPETSPTFVSGASTLVLKIPSINNNGVIADKYDFVIFTKDNGNPKILRMKIIPDGVSTRVSADQVLTSMLNSIIFSYYDKSGGVVSPVGAFSVGLSVNVASGNGAGNQSRTSSTTTNLRNN